MKVSDYVIKFLESKNIKNVFTISGGGCMHLIDSLGKSKINYICNHHEQATAMAVEGYARMNGHIGAAIVTTGPGGTNTITGVMGCWTDSVPSLFISGQVQTGHLSVNTGCRQVGDQEINITEIVKSITKYAKTVLNKNEIPYELEKAYQIATTGRPGPVWIDIPLDIQSQDINLEEIKFYDTEYVYPSPEHSELEYVINSLKNAKKPLLIVGSGIRLSPGGLNNLRKFLDLTKIPVVTGIHSAVDTVNETYENYFGRIGVLGQKSSNRIVQESDLIISVGSRLTIKMTGFNYKAFGKNAIKIVVDIDKHEMNKFNIIADKKIYSDSGNFFQSLINKKEEYYDKIDISEWSKYCKNIRKNEELVLKKHRDVKNITSNYTFIEELSKLIPENVPTITSNGSAHVITLKVMQTKGEQRLFTNVGCASMGYGLPAAIGACVANDYKKTICIEGDGSLQMNIQELQTVVHHKLPLLIFVINNEQYLSIKITQDTYFNSNYVGSNIESGVSCPDLSKIANAYGIKYYSIKTNDEIKENLELIMKETGPIICEVFTDPNERHEPKVVSKMNQDGTFSPGELTDMA